MTGTKQMIYQDALFRGVSGGSLQPFEQKLLSDSPLPESMLMPFLKQSTNLTDALKITAEALNTWGREAQKTSYFSKHFTDLSKMIMQGVTVIGRGLATLHANGEDITLSPMSIQDLIMIASYHLRKSYLGVLQTAKKYPEISTRLMSNQLSWANMIFRLYRTKDNLEKPVKRPVIQSDEKKRPAMAANKDGGLSAPDALSDGGALCAVHGFSPISGEKASAESLVLKAKASGRIEASKAIGDGDTKSSDDALETPSINEPAADSLESEESETSQEPQCDSTTSCEEGNSQKTENDTAEGNIPIWKSPQYAAILRRAKQRSQSP